MSSRLEAFEDLEARIAGLTPEELLAERELLNEGWELTIRMVQFMIGSRAEDGDAGQRGARAIVADSLRLAARISDIVFAILEEKGHPAHCLPLVVEILRSYCVKTEFDLAGKNPEWEIILRALWDAKADG